LFHQAFDLPRCAQCLRKRNIFYGRIDPSFEEGIVPVSNALHTLYNHAGARWAKPSTDVIPDAGR